MADPESVPGPMRKRIRRELKYTALGLWVTLTVLGHRAREWERARAAYLPEVA